MSSEFPTGETFRDVIVVPYSDLLDRWRDGEIHRGGPIWSDWDEQTAARHCRRGAAVDDRPADPQGLLAEAGPMAWGGAIVDVFGHQVADFSMRLLETRLARPDLPIAFATRPEMGWTTPESTPVWFRSILDWFGVPAERVRLITQPTSVTELFVAPQAEQLNGPGPDDAYLDALDAHVRARLTDAPEPKLGLLYVSRAGMEARFAGEGYLESALAQAGARVMRPETLALSDQIRAYREAPRILFAEGSALHVLQLMGRTDADVSVLERRPGSRLAAANLRPRLRKLTYAAAASGLIHGLLPTGRLALPGGLSLADEDMVLGAARELGVDPGRAWDAREFRAARDADVLHWIDLQVRHPERHGAGSVEYILERLESQGLSHLTDAAAACLAPLQATLAPTALRSRPTEPDRPTLLYMHIPRVAGTAVREALEAVIPPRKRREVYDELTVDGSMTADAFALLPEEERAALSLVTGDFAYGFHRLIPDSSRYVTMLRHPVDRIVSLHALQASQDPATAPLEAWAFGDRRIATDNAMVRAISGRTDAPFGDCPDDMLQEAIEHIDSDFAAVLSRGEMPRSMVILGHVAGAQLPPVRDRNTGPPAPEVGKSLRKRLRELNHLDVQLFRAMADRL